MNKTLIAGLVAAAALIGGWHLVYGDGGTLMNGGGLRDEGVLYDGSDPVPTDNLGAVGSPEVFSYLRVHGAFTQGGGVLATSSTDTTEQIQSADMREYNVLDITPLTGSATYTLPATTTFPLLSKPGSMRSWVFRNASTTSGITITLASGTDIDLQEPDGQNVVISNTNFAWLTCYRKLNSDIACLVDESIPAD